MTQCTPTSTLLAQIGDETTRRAGRLHDDLGLPRSCIERWVHDQRADERREQWPFYPTPLIRECYAAYLDNERRRKEATA